MSARISMLPRQSSRASLCSLSTTRTAHGQNQPSVAPPAVGTPRSKRLELGPFATFRTGKYTSVETDDLGEVPSTTRIANPSCEVLNQGRAASCAPAVSPGALESE